VIAEMFEQQVHMLDKKRAVKMNLPSLSVALYRTLGECATENDTEDQPE
jgi:hypothetical protein